MTFLVITDPGSYIGSKKKQFKISFGMADKPVSYVPANRVEGIVIDVNTTLSSGALNLLADFGIPVIWNDYQNDGMILLPYKAHGSVDLRRAQYEAIMDHRGVHIARQITFASSRNKISVLSRIKRYVPELQPLVEPQLQTMKQYNGELEGFEIDLLDLKSRQILMSHEAKIAKEYFQGINHVLEYFGWEFNKRTRRPAENPANALLNYGYAILKGQLTNAIAISGLDIFAGFLHTDRSGRVSLVLDIIEEFRQVCIDEVIIRLIIGDELKESHFEKDEGVEITKSGKSVFVTAIFEQINRRIRALRLKKWFIRQGRQIGSYLRNRSETYDPFLLQVRDPW